MSRTASPRSIRFGVFEVDLSARELRKRGVRVKLQDQPFRVLEALLEKPGEIVTREELKERLWAQDEFVEFDKSLNTAVQKIRQALGDSASSPRFLETLPKVGYRFVGAAETRGPADPADGRGPRLRLAGALAALAVVAVLAWRFIGPLDSSFDPGDYRFRRVTFDDGLAYQADISADGKLIVYASDRAGEGSLDIWLQQTSGDQSIRLTEGQGDELEPSFSPDGSQVVFRSDRSGGIYVVSTLGGVARPLAPAGRRPRFSPDGKRVAFWTGKPHTPGLPASRVYWVPAEGGEPHEVGFGRSPVWSPDGSRVLYLRSDRVESAEREWALVDLDAAEPTATGAVGVLKEAELAGDYSILGPKVFVPDRWLGDGRVLFSSGESGAVSVWSIHISPQTGEVERPPLRLTTASAEHRYPSASGDARFVLSDVRENRDIWLLPMDPASGKVVGEPLHATSNGAADERPALSADGTTLAFRSNRAGAPDVWMKKLEADKARQLTDTEIAEGSILVSPDGKFVTYRVGYSTETARASDTFKIRISDGRVEKLCEHCGSVSDWSPSGNFLVGYFRSRAAEAAGLNAAVTLTDLRSGKSRIIFANQPDWRFSPDERWLAFHNSSRGGVDRRQVFVAPFPAKGQIREEQLIPITDGSDNSFRAAWSGGGELVYYISDRDGYRCIYAQPVDPKTKRPEGPAREVYHQHSARLSMRPIGNSGDLGLSVARDKIAVAMAETTSEIWIMEPNDAE